MRELELKAGSMDHNLRLDDAVVAIERSARAHIVDHVVAKDAEDALILWTTVALIDLTPSHDEFTDSRMSRCRPDVMLPCGNGICHVPLAEFEPLP